LLAQIFICIKSVFHQYYFTADSKAGKLLLALRCFSVFRKIGTAAGYQ